MDFKTIKFQQHNKHILIIKLNRPEVLNAINQTMVEELDTLLQSLDSQVRCIIITGEGRAFCAGADLKERKDISVDEWKSKVNNLRKLIFKLMHLPIPVITAVNGVAFGGGLEMILASDFAYAAKDSSFSQSEVKLGIIPGALGTQNLPKACGIKRAKELIFTGNAFTAKDAHSWGIINEVFSADELLEKTIQTAEKISENAPIAIKEAKKSLNSSLENDLTEGFHKELNFYETALTSKDREEGIKAFIEKRKPSFTGE